MIRSAAHGPMKSILTTCNTRQDNGFNFSPANVLHKASHVVTEALVAVKCRTLCFVEGKFLDVKTVCMMVKSLTPEERVLIESMNKTIILAIIKNFGA